MGTQVQSDPDIELMLRAQRGDEEAFEELAEKYRRPLTSFFYSLCWNYDSAQDFAQEVLVRVWLSRERYEARAKLSTYIYRIARNHWLMALRARSCRIQPLYLEETWDPSPAEQDLERLLMRRYEDRRVKTAVSGLSERYRLVFVLSQYQDLKYSEIAEILEIPVGTVKSRMSAAVRMLREWLMADG